MADPQTVNVGLSVPLRGTDVGTWDVPVNGDFNALDGLFGGVQTLSVSSAPILLTSPAGFTPTPGGGPTQSQNAVVRFTGVLTSGVQVTLPLPGFIIIENLTTGAFVLSFRAIGSGEVVGVEQGVIQHLYNDGTNVRFVNLPTVGSYMDICDATVPAWITACTKPPWLDCNGTTFSAVTYPYLNTKLGGTTLPDFRGRGAFYLNEGTARLTSAGAGIDGNTRFATGGNNGITASQLPGVTSSGSNSISLSPPAGQTFPAIAGGNSVNSTQLPTGTGSGVFAPTTPANIWGGQNVVTGSPAISVTSNNTQSVGATMPNAAPGTVSGIRLIRAA